MIGWWGEPWVMVIEPSAVWSILCFGADGAAVGSPGSYLFKGIPFEYTCNNDQTKIRLSEGKKTAQWLEGACSWHLRWSLHQMSLKTASEKIKWIETLFSPMKMPGGQHPFWSNFSDASNCNWDTFRTHGTTVVDQPFARRQFTRWLLLSVPWRVECAESGVKILDGFIVNVNPGSINHGLLIRGVLLQ